MSLNNIIYDLSATEHDNFNHGNFKSERIEDVIKISIA